MNKWWINPKTGEKYRYYDKQGNGIVEVLTWANLVEEDHSYKIIKQDIVGKAAGYWVSTIWMGIDYSFGAGPPLIFETMVFPNKVVGGVENFGELDMNRYSTQEEALKGHEKLCKKYQNL